MTQITPTEEQEYINKLSKEFLITHTREQELETLAQLNNREIEDIKGYHGREILELLQNIDDAFEKKRKENPDLAETAKAKIEYKNNILTISNTGTSFDKNGIKSICAGNLSTKNSDYLGNKGTGFRSVLNWASKIFIYSGNFNIEFSEEIAKSKFEEIKENPQIIKNKEYQQQHGKSLYIPMLSVPRNVEPIDKNGFDTIIQITIDKNRNDDNFSVGKQIEEFDFKSLLFLPNIAEISFEIEDNTYSYKKEKDDNSTDELTIFNLTNSNNPGANEAYYFDSKTISKAVQWKNETEKRDIKIAIAIPYNKNQKEIYKIYSFFPCLNTQSPFNAIFHGTYNLGSDRNNIATDNEKANQKVIEEQLKFYVEFAMKFTKPEFNTRAIEILTPNNFSFEYWTFKSAFGKFDLEEFYLDLLSEAKILPTVNDSFISIKENPKLFTAEFPNVIRGEQFNDLLQLLETEANDNLIKKIASKNDIDLNYTVETLCEKINNSIINWSIEDKVKIFFWWENQFKEKDFLPKLLKDRSDSYIEYKSDCYFVVGSAIADIPKWANFRELNSQYSDKLFEYAKNEETIKNEITNENPVHRVLARTISNINFQYVDNNTIISTIYKFVNKDYDKSIEFLKWLWTNYGQKENWKFNAFDDTWLFPTTQKTTFDSKKCYFGADYGNEFGRKLFKNTSYEEIISYNVFSIEQDEIDLFKNFLKKFGVLEMPEIKTVTKHKDDQYIQFAKRQIKYPIQNWSWGEEYYERDINISSLTVSTIENLAEILGNLSISEVIQWILNDLKIENTLKQSYSEHNVIDFLPKGKRTNRTHGGLYNYILWQFQNTKWITIKEKKYAPIECLFENNTIKKYQI